MEILINERSQLFPHNYNSLTKIRNHESVIQESVSARPVLEQVLPQNRRNGGELNHSFQYSHSFQCSLRAGDRNEVKIRRNMLLFYYSIPHINLVVFRKLCSHIICNPLKVVVPG